MQVKAMLVSSLKKDLLEIVNKHIKRVVTIENNDAYKEYLDKIKFETKYGKTILFTNANGWYVSTLVSNLIKSMVINDPAFSSKLRVICSDEEAYNTAIKCGMKDPFLVKMPLLEVDKLYQVTKTEDYLRLVFVKIVLIHQALKYGYNVIYIDPDMAFVKPSLQYVIDRLDKTDLILAGFKDGNMNTNIIGALPTQNNIALFEVDMNMVEANIINYSLYKRPGISDEEMLIIKDEYEPDKIHYLDADRFPPGKHTDSARNTMILHANGVKGLENKIDFLKKYNGWFL